MLISCISFTLSKPNSNPSSSPSTPSTQTSYEGDPEYYKSRLTNTPLNTPYPPPPTHTHAHCQGDPEYYKSRLTNALGNDFANFTIEKKADATYKVVS